MSAMPRVIIRDGYFNGQVATVWHEDDEGRLYVELDDANLHDTACGDEDALYLLEPGEWEDCAAPVGTPAMEGP